jgi:hypothetical protein
MAVTKIANREFFSQTIDMDDKRFLGCKFTNCRLRYTGGQCEWDKNTTFISCSWNFFDAADRTIKVRNIMSSAVDFDLANESFSTH